MHATVRSSNLRAMNERTKETLRRLLRGVGLELRRTPPFVKRSWAFRPSRAADAMLAPSLRQPVAWVADPTPPAAQGDLAAIFRSIPGGHKWLHYFQIYEETFAKKRGTPLRILELGVYHGGSLAMWKRYFHPDSVIVGLDINPDCQRFHDPANGVHVVIGPQQDAALLSRIVREHGPFDVIIDDGSHVVSHMVASFNALFGEGLRPDGLYLVEDTQSNYWVGLRDQPLSFVDLAKHLVDMMHVHYLQTRGEEEYRVGLPERVTHFTVPRITTMLREIRFFDSVIVFCKNEPRSVPSTVLLPMQERA
jgi:cephalosporin hydroxylase